MENGWQMKCGMQSPSLDSGSSLRVASSSEQIQLQQEARNQLNTNMSHCILPHDMREQGPLSSQMKQAPTSNILNFGSCKPTQLETGSSFCSLLSAPPSLLQYDLQRQLNVHSSSGGCILDTPAQGNIGTMKNWQLLQNSANYNARAVVNIRPVFPMRSIMNANNGSSHGLSDDLSTLRASITHPGSQTENGINILQKGVTCAPLSSSNFPEASLQASTSVHKKQNSVVSGYPRVFCMGACGDLLLSNTGLFGVLCSCHGMRMSVSKFCEHSGLSDVNPGYAVRMDSGDSIAQWRKMYLQKFGIRAPGDHRGWDWPEGLLATSGLTNSSMAVADKRKVFDMSSLFNPSAESSMQPRNNVSPSRPRAIQDFPNQIVKNAQIACTSRNLRPTLLSDKDGPGDGCLSRSFQFTSSCENSSSSALLNLQRIGSKANNNSKDEVVQQRGPISSSVELKLGQPSQLSWGSGTVSLPAMRLHTSGVQITTAQDMLNPNLTNAKVSEKNQQHIFHHSAPDSCREKKSFVSGPLNNALTSFLAGPLNSALIFTNGAAHVEHLKDGLHNNCTNSVKVPSSNSTARGNLYPKEINRRIKDSHPLSPWTVHCQPHVDRSVLIDFSCNGDPPIRPLDISKTALPNKMSKAMDATCGNEGSNVGSGSSSGFARNGEPCNPNSTILPAAKFSIYGMVNMSSDVSGASNYVRNACNLASNLDRDQFSNKLKNPSLNSRASSTLQATSTDFTPLSAAATGHGSSSFSKDVEAVNSHTRIESLKLHALGDIDKSSKERPPDTSLALDQQPKIHSNHILQIENCGIPDLRAKGLFFDQGSYEAQRHGRQSSVGHITSPSFLPDVGHKKGTNLGANSEEMTIFSKLTGKYNKNTSNQQPTQQSELSVGRQENMECDCNVVQGCTRESSSHISCRCYYNVQKACSKRKQESKGSGSVYGLKKQESVAIVETPKYSNSKISDDCVSIEKAFRIECNHKEKEHNVKLDCGNSQWTDVPPNANANSKMKFPDATAHMSDSSKESETYLKELATKGIFKSNQAAALKGKELSDISSDCSAPVVTQASNEVDRIDSSTVDGGHKVCDNVQIADQGSSAVSISSSDEAIDSVRNLQVSDGNTRSTEEKSLSALENVAHHKEIYEFRQTYSNSNELQSFSVSGGNSDENPNKTQNENVFKCKKRKRTNKWKMLGTTFTFSNQSNQNTSTMLNVSSSYNCLKQGRSALFAAKILSRKRDCNGIYNIVEGEPSDQEPLKGNDDSVEMPENALVKKVKQVKPPEVAKFTEAVKTYAVHKPISDRTWKDSTKDCQKMKPVACGKYGIICDQELDIDQLKPPKIVPLSQVLKASKRLKFEKEPVVPSIKKKKKKNICCYVGRERHDVPSSSYQDQDSRNNKVWSDASNQETQKMHLKNMQPDNADASEGGEINLNTSTSHPASASKTKELRMRSLYELSMRDISRSQNVMSAQPTVCGLEMITLKDAERCDGGKSRDTGRRSCRKLHNSSLMSEVNKLCCVCGISNKDNANCLLECGHCSIQIHQACYGISRVPKGDWYCRPCKTSSKDVACVLCGYGDGAMTRAFGSRNVVKSLLKAWDIRTEPHIMSVGSTEALYVPAKMECLKNLESATCHPCPSIKPVVHNSIISGLFDPTVKQWVHMVCGLWTPGTRCPNVDTMSAFDVSGVSNLKEYMVCYICKRVGGSCIRCYVETCCTYFHPWCAHQKGLLQSEVEGVDRDQIGFYGRCLFHADSRTCHLENDIDTNKENSETGQEEEPTCARTEGYKGKIQGDGGHYSSYQHRGKGGCLVTQVQVDAWLYINRHKLSRNKLPKPSVSDIDHDYRKEYARYKQAKCWKHLVVYKSGIHALGLYTSQFFQRGAMVVEYVGEIVGYRVADKRETEYLSGRKLQYKSACYFFRIDKEQIIDATCKGGIARFVNHSCQPNCVAKVLTVRGEKKVVFLAQRDIYPGEEITYDYHFNREDEGKKIPCFCNSKNCRRYLN
ncbi:uncharacterized protein LOC110733636 isoform X2 [Chenopodium quinoa]|uniref:uncharacterized protein LOC110733636 isoform X2 n=1 Tax=Chenopodium quinoa TaxID=63459 RepID=UPI000B794DB6|nr:uncharacterized protein LOC110733636 isoform X2 [Chenopodium quinoa]